MLMFKKDQVSDVHPSKIEQMKNRGWSDKAPTTPKRKKVIKKEAN
jgi:hypothetical protein